MPCATASSGASKRASCPYDHGRLLLVLRDVTERHRAANRIRELAFFDPLTQLPNRQYLLQLLEEARREAATTGERFAVVRINLDNSNASTTASVTAPATRCCRPWLRASAPSSSSSATAR